MLSGVWWIEDAGCVASSLQPVVIVPAGAMPRFVTAALPEDEEAEQDQGNQHTGAEDVAQQFCQQLDADG